MSELTRYCTECGSQIPASDRESCSSCGAGISPSLLYQPVRPVTKPALDEPKWTIGGILIAAPIFLAMWAVLGLVVWGGLHYFLGVPAPSALPFPEPRTEWLDVFDGYWAFVLGGGIGLVVLLISTKIKIVKKILDILATAVISLVVFLVVWGGLHYFLGVPAPSALPFPEPRTASSPSAEFESADSLTRDLEDRAKEMYKHIDGSESGWRKTYKYLTPQFRSQCTEDEHVETAMQVSTMFMGWNTKYKADVLSVSESGNVGTVMIRLVADSENWIGDPDSEKWIKVDGTWWSALWEDENQVISLPCQD